MLLNLLPDMDAVTLPGNQKMVLLLDLQNENALLIKPKKTGSIGKKEYKHENNS